MIVRKQRLKHGWSQKQLAEMAGLTSRTIQRIERGHKGSLETYKALASVFEIEFENIQSERIDNSGIEENMNESTLLSLEEQEALSYAKRVKEFYEVSVRYIVVAIVFLILFQGNSIILAILGALGFCIALQGLLAFEVFGIFSPHYERKLAEKKLGRKI